MRRVNTALTCVLYAIYPALLLWLLFRQDDRFIRVLLVPGIPFVLVTLLRNGCNAPRPYEILNIHPLIYKNTKGHSFPSRHVFSISVIATAFWYVKPWIGIVLLFCAVLMAVIRVLGGVHFPRDVIVGLLIGIGAGIVGFVLL